MRSFSRNVTLLFLKGGLCSIEIAEGQSPLQSRQLGFVISMSCVCSHSSFAARLCCELKSWFTFAV